MPRAKRFEIGAVTIRTVSIGVAFVLMLGVLAAVIEPSFPDYSPRQKVGIALQLFGNVRGELTEQCGQGAFKKNQNLQALPINLIDYQSVVANAVLDVPSESSASLKIAMREIQGVRFWVVPVTAIPAGRELVFEFTCASRKLEWRLAATSIEPKFLPGALR